MTYADDALPGGSVGTAGDAKGGAFAPRSTPTSPLDARGITPDPRPTPLAPDTALGLVGAEAPGLVEDHANLADPPTPTPVLPEKVRGGGGPRMRTDLGPGSKRELRDLERRVRTPGFALDGRTSGARALAAWREAITSDLGGDLSQAESTLLDLAVVDAALIGACDEFLAECGPKVLNRSTGRLKPIVEQRQRIALHLQGLLRDLGLKRVARPIPTLSEVFHDEA